MKHEPTDSAQRAQMMENLLRDFGVRPMEGRREELYRCLEEQRDKFITIERVHGKGKDRDISR